MGPFRTSPLPPSRGESDGPGGGFAVLRFRRGEVEDCRLVRYETVAADSLGSVEPRTGCKRFHRGARSSKSKAGGTLRPVPFPSQNHGLRTGNLASGHTLIPSGTNGGRWCLVRSGVDSRRPDVPAPSLMPPERGARGHPVSEHRLETRFAQGHEGPAGRRSEPSRLASLRRNDRRGHVHPVP